MGLNYWLCVHIFLATLLKVASSPLFRKVTKVWPREGSLNGATRITIYGKGFAESQYFNTGETPVGNSVNLVSKTQSFPCDIHIDGTHERQIMCYTRPMPKDTYDVRVTVDSEPIPTEKHCSTSRNMCQFRPHTYHTPTITRVVSEFSQPNTLINITGKFYTKRFGSHERPAEKGQAEIKRVFVGGQKCELRKPDSDEYYHLDKKEMTCKVQGSYVGNMNVSLIIGGAYGRSKPSRDTLFVTGQSKIAMFQTYAEVTSVQPDMGSTEGGQRLTITGRNFDETDTKAQVYVGGKPCKVEQESLRDDQIICITPKAATPESIYPGNHGVYQERFHASSLRKLTWDQVLNITEPASKMEHLDQWKWLEHDNNNGFLTRMKGFFRAPADSDYRFYIHGDDEVVLYMSPDEYSANKKQIAQVSIRTSNYFRKPEQTSERLQLKKGKMYYMEVWHKNDGGKSHVSVGAKMFQTPYLENQARNVQNEKQTIYVVSQQQSEIQVIERKNWKIQRKVKESQKITITATNLHQVRYRLGMRGVFTGPINGAAYADEVEAALNDLPSIAPETVSVNKRAGDQLVTLYVTFDSEMGDWPELTAERYEYDQSDASFSVTEIRKGVPSLKYYAFSYGNVTSEKIHVNASTSEIKASLRKIFRVHCPKPFVRPVRPGFYRDYEASDCGKYCVKEVEPFCGEHTYNLNLAGGTVFGSENVNLEENKMMCFAHLGKLKNMAWVGYMYYVGNKEYSKARNFFPDFGNNDQYGWRYVCVDLLRHVKEYSPEATEIRVYWIQLYTLGKVYIDNFYLGPKEPTQDLAGITGKRRLRPYRGRVRDIHVEKQDYGTVQLTIDTMYCDQNFPLLGIWSGEQLGDLQSGEEYTASGWPSGVSWKTTRISEASPPLGGTFGVTFKGNEMNDIPVDIKPALFKDKLETLPGVGAVEVKQAMGSSCSKVGLDINWLTATGDQPAFQVNISGIKGLNVTSEVKTRQDGGVFFSHLPGDLIHTAHDKPQVHLFINDIPTKCSGNCTYEWTDDATPTVTSLSTNAGSPGDELTVTGTGFSINPADDQVMIGGVGCTVTAATDAQLTCTVGEGPAGLHDVIITVAQKGIAKHVGGRHRFAYGFAVTGISPESGSLAGGTILTVSGHGFAPDAAVTLVENDCEINKVAYSNIICVTPPGEAGGENVNVSVTNEGVTQTSPVQFQYDTAKTPTITSLSTNRALVLGGTPLTITGEAFGSNFTSFDAVKVGGRTAVIKTYHDREIVVTLPSKGPGSYPLHVTVGTDGLAKGDNVDLNITYNLKVNSVRPSRGSMEGGTKITLLGEGFSDRSSDNKVMIRNKKCDVTSATTTRIFCTTPGTAIVHHIDNMGSHPDYGRGYAWNVTTLQVKVGDTVRWHYGVPRGVTGIQFMVEETEGPSETKYNDIGFKSGQPVPRGTYSKTFTRAGIHYYWSGYVDQQKNIVMRGVISVVTRPSVVEDVSVTVADHEAKYFTQSGVSYEADRSACPGLEDQISGCRDPLPSPSDASTFGFDYWSCMTPTVTEMSPLNGTTDDDIIINGTGFSTTACQNEVKIGGQPCVVATATETTLTCKINASGVLQVGVAHPLSVVVNNRGIAHIDIRKDSDQHFDLYPLVTSVSPNVGSVNGQTTLVITGDGFSGSVKDTTVLVGNHRGSCMIQSVTYTEIVCITSKGNAHVGDVIVNINVNSQRVKAVCKGTCTFEFSTQATPVVENINPTVISGPNTVLNITGTGFGTKESGTEIKIGGDSCQVTDFTDTLITCRLASAVAGNQQVKIVVPNRGLATNPNDSVSVQPLAADVSPAQGSINGGTRITINGHGFKVGVTSVTIGELSCSLESVTPTNIVCITAPHVAAGLKITIKSNSITFPQLDYAYSMAYTPVVTSLSASSGKPGDDITITGSGFGSQKSDVNVTIGGASCTLSLVSDSSITCKAGDKPAGRYPVHVVVFTKGTATSDQEFNYDLIVNSISPNGGSFGGGQIVTIYGAGFDQASTIVKICDSNCTIQPNTSATQLLCETPAISGSGIEACDVVVEDIKLGVTQTAIYRYESSLTPKIDSVSPVQGGTAGGLPVTITGSGFGSQKDDIDVSIGGTDCIVTSATDTQVVCKTTRSTYQKTKVMLAVTGKGRATAAKGNTDFEFIDLWSSVYSWSKKEVPGAGGMVVINKTQVLDMDTPVYKMVLILGGGKLIFDEKDVTLNAERILITNGGVLQVGTEDKPYRHKAVIQLHGRIRSRELPVYGTKVLAVRGGTLDLHGKPVGVTWTVLAATVNAGSNQITLHDSVPGWNIGDKIVIASTGHRHTQMQNEEHEITAKSADDRTLTLKSPLAYKHLGETVTVSDGVTLEARAEVGLLTRNIVVRGTDDTQWHDKVEKCEDGFDTGEFATQTCFQGRFGEEMGSDQFGAHILLHAGHGSRVTGRISNVEVTHAGQAFRLGRYPIHFHMNGDMPGSYVRECAIHKSFNRAVNIHGSHQILVERNVVYNIMGGAIFLEDSIETGNILRHNLAVFVKSSTSLQNDDITPAGFWVTNPNNTIEHNHVAGGTHFGFWYRMQPHPDGPSFDPDICPQNAPLGIFQNNTVHSQGWFGLWIFETYRPKKGGACYESQDEPAQFNSLTAWNCEKGAEWVNGGAIQFVDFKLINNEKAGIEMKLAAGPKFTNDSAMIKGGIIAAKPSVSGILEGSSTYLGVILPLSPGFQVRDVTFINFEDKHNAVFGVNHNYNGGFTYRTSGLTFVNSPRVIRWRWQSEGNLHDLDGSLTGIKGGKALPSIAFLPKDQCSNEPRFSIGVPGSRCAASVTFHRWSFNDVNVQRTMNYKNISFITATGTGVARLTHKNGWVIILPGKQPITMEYEEVNRFQEIRYRGMINDLEPGDYIIIKHAFAKMPNDFHILPGDNESRALSENPLTYDDNYNGDVYMDKKTMELSYIISDKERHSGNSSNDSRFKDVNVQFHVRHCQFRGCKDPPDPETTPPVTERPDDAGLWSNNMTWEHLMGVSGESSSDGITVTIPKYTWIVLDTQPPKINDLIIYGTLEFEYKPKEDGSYHDFTLSCNRIFVAGGRLIVGWEDKPMRGSVKIILRGNPSTRDTTLPDDPRIGVKAIGIFGGFDAHGLNHTVQWTRLASSAMAGASLVTLKEPVDWEAGDEIVIAPSRFSPEETEVRKIIAVSEDLRTLKLNSSLAFDHLVTTQKIKNDGSKVITLAAEVGLLTRNVKIISEEYQGMHSEYFGARVLVGRTRIGDKLRTGFARISNVEFVRTGQEGVMTGHHYSLHYRNTGTTSAVKPSYVKQCSFNQGFFTAVGITGASKIEVTDNVIYRTIGSSFIIQGRNNRLRRNLITLVLWPGGVGDRYETTNTDWTSGIEAKDAHDIVLEDNVVAGSERAGFRVNGQSCSVGDVSTAQWKGNVAHSNLIGILHFRQDSRKPSCVHLPNFLVYKSYHFGIFFQNDASQVYSNLISVDNNVGLFPYVIGSSSVEPSAERFVQISDSVFIGSTTTFDCIKDTWNKSTANFQLAHFSASFRSKSDGKIGLTFTTFTSAFNKVGLDLPFMDIMGYQSLSGKTSVNNVTFVNFAESCDGRQDVAIATSPMNDDSIHPMYLRRTTQVNVAIDNKVFYHRPRDRKINPSDCVDIDRYGHKKALLKDMDGTFFWGVNSSIVPESEWEWDGDKKRGLGDYCIPKHALVTKHGDRIPISEKGPYKGIIRDDTCKLQPAYQAYECHGLDYEMLMLASLDHDRKTRRLSPIALFGDKYVDVINGPQRRLSTFPIVVATGKYYELYYTGTSPQHTVLYFLNTNKNQAFVIGIYYAKPNRLDVYKNRFYMMPLNAFTSNGHQEFRKPTTPGEYMPDVVTHPGGTNFFDHETNLLHVLVRGNTPIEIIQSPLITLSFTVQMTVDEFFGDNLVNNLALFLDIPPDKIWYSEAVSADSKRRRRAAETRIDVYIGNQPKNNTKISNEADLSAEKLQELSSKIINEVQVGGGQTLFPNKKLLRVAIEEPVPRPGSPGWEQMTSAAFSASPVFEIEIPARAVVTKKLVVLHEGTAFSTQPGIRVLNAKNQPIGQLGPLDHPWKVTASLQLGTGSDRRAVLLGDATTVFAGGWANFTNLAISHSGQDYSLVFEIQDSQNGTTRYTLTVNDITVPLRKLSADIASPANATANEAFDLEMEIIDAVTMETVADPGWKGHSWNCIMSQHMPDISRGHVTQSTRSASVNVNRNRAVFNGLNITASGRYFFAFHCVSTPPDFDYVGVSSALQVLPEGWIPPDPEEMKQVSMTFYGDFDLVVKGQEAEFAAAVLNRFTHKLSNVSFTDGRAEKGSIKVWFYVTGPRKDVEAALDDLWELLKSPLSVEFDNYTVKAAPIMHVDGKEFYGRDGPPEMAGAPLSTRGIILIGIVLMVLIAVFLTVILVWNIKFAKKAATIGPSPVPGYSRQVAVHIMEMKKISVDDLAVREANGKGTEADNKAYQAYEYTHVVPVQSKPPADTAF